MAFRLVEWINRVTKLNKTTMDTFQNNIKDEFDEISIKGSSVASNGTASSSSSSFEEKNICNLTLNKGKYLGLFAGESTISSERAVIIKLAGDANVSFQAGLTTYRGSMQAGGGVSGWRIFEITEGTGVVTLSAYVDNTYSIRGQLCAIKL